MTISLSGWALDGITGYYRNARTQKSVYSIFKSLMDLSTGDSPLLPPLSIPTMTPSYDGNFQGCTIRVRRQYSIMDQPNLQPLKAPKDRKRQSCAPFASYYPREHMAPMKCYPLYLYPPMKSLSCPIVLQEAYHIRDMLPSLASSTVFEQRQKRIYWAYH
jgi:hypothetical protein